mgnify:CR=1 FL=1
MYNQVFGFKHILNEKKHFDWVRWHKTAHKNNIFLSKHIIQENKKNIYDKTNLVFR